MLKIEGFKNRSDNYVRFLAVLLGFSIPISTAGDSILLALLFLVWILGGRYSDKIKSIMINPVAMSSIALVGLFIVGVFYGSAATEDFLETLKDVSVLFLIPVLVPLFEEKEHKQYAIIGLLTAILITLLLSYMLWFGLLPEMSIIKGTGYDPCVFKYHTTHNIFMAYGAFLLAFIAARSSRLYLRLVCAILCGFAVFNVLFMVRGKTGYAVIFVLFMYFFFRIMNWRGLVAAVMAFVIIGGIAYYGAGSSFREGTMSSIKQVKEWTSGKAVATTDSVGLRLEYYRNSLSIIADHPFFGVGTGGFKTAYEKKVANTSMDRTDNPHNEFIMVTVQLGLLGLFLLLSLFAIQWKYASLSLDYSNRMLAQGMLLVILSASLVNSTLMDHSEGLFFSWISGILYSGVTFRVSSEG